MTNDVKNAGIKKYDLANRTSEFSMSVINLCKKIIGLKSIHCWALVIEILNYSSSLDIF